MDFDIKRSWNQSLINTEGTTPCVYCMVTVAMEEAVEHYTERTHCN
jgi:hypothetical protein